MPQDDQALLARLKRSQVEFVVVGGVACVLHGASYVTYDLDICISLAPQNLYRIETAVEDLHPFHRLAANKLPLELTEELCTRLKNLYLQTDLGVLDCLGEIAGVGDYEQSRGTLRRLVFSIWRVPGAVVGRAHRSERNRRKRKRPQGTALVARHSKTGPNPQGAEISPK